MELVAGRRALSIGPDGEAARERDLGGYVRFVRYSRAAAHRIDQPADFPALRE